MLTWLQFFAQITDLYKKMRMNGLACALVMDSDWQSNAIKFADSVALLYDRKDSADIVIQVGKEKESILAHKFVLVTRSPVIDSALRVVPTKRVTYHDKEYMAMDALDMDPLLFRIFLKYLYSNKLEAKTENANGLLHIAKFYDVPAFDELVRKHFPVNVITLNDIEIAAKKFNITTDSYERGNEKVNKLSSLAFSTNDISIKTHFRTSRSLTLADGRYSGEIAWKVDLSGHRIQSVKVNLGRLTTYRRLGSNGRIVAMVTLGNKRMQIDTNTDSRPASVITRERVTNAEFSIDDVHEADYLTILVQFNSQDVPINMFRSSNTANMVVEINLA